MKIGIDRLVETRFPAFGLNKRREVTRLVFEIAKREQLTPDVLVNEIPLGCKSYAAVKDLLIKRRFPEAVARREKIRESFSALDITPASAMPLSRPDRIPDPLRVYIEDGLDGTALVQRARVKFSSAAFIPIKSYQEHCQSIKFDIPSYNKRTEELFIVREAYDHFKPCPCSGGAVPCGYHNANLGFGCPFECSYCFLQDYTNAPGIVLPANLDDFLDAFNKYRPHVRVGSGETSDSLVFDDLTGFAPRIVEFFRSCPQSIFEFKTKSDNIAGLLSVKASSNIVVGWSLNPQELIDREESFTASLKDRLAAAGHCAAHGYKTAFHFDPVIHFPGWEEKYAGVIYDLFKAVPSESMAWISVGALRMTAEQKKTIENRFPQNTILDAELLTAEDGKLRYAHKVRLDIYRRMIARIKEHAHPLTQIYLCMETASMWKDVGMKLDQLFKS